MPSRERIIGTIGFATLAVGRNHGRAVAVAAGHHGRRGRHTRQTGEATGVNTVIRTVGGALGARVSAAIITAYTTPDSALPGPRGYPVAFTVWAAAGVANAGHHPSPTPAGQVAKGLRARNDSAGRPPRHRRTGSPRTT